VSVATLVLASTLISTAFAFVDPSNGFLSLFPARRRFVRSTSVKRRCILGTGEGILHKGHAPARIESNGPTVSEKMRRMNFRFLRGRGVLQELPSRCIFLSTEEIHRTSSRYSSSLVFQCPNGSGLCRSDSPHKTSASCYGHS
jgi:hypothetical protein